MVNFTADQIREMMDKRHNIRNISVIAHVDHGKSTLTDSLISAAGIIAKSNAGNARFMDTRADEQERTITIKSTGVSLYYEVSIEDEDGVEIKKEPSLINLIDSPGHVDFSSEVTAALRVTDGALVVVDCVEGVCVQTETVLRQAISERIKPVLFVNKMDRIFLEMGCDLEEAYQNFSRAVESVNVVIGTYLDERLGDVTVYPELGTVGFGSGLHGWGFTVKMFSKLYAKKLGFKVPALMKLFWGSNFYNSKKNKWVKKQFTSKNRKLTRGFVEFILKPIKQLFDSVMGNEADKYKKMLKRLKVKIPKRVKNEKGKKLLKGIMQEWLPAADCLLGMIVGYLPSPVTAQKYRVHNLYAGDKEDEAAKAIAACDPKGGLVMYISKMVPTSDKGRFYAFGRVFSGTVKTGQEVRIQGPAFKQGSKHDLSIKKIQRTVLMMGRNVEQLQDCPCGNLCGLVGIDQFLKKSGTLTTIKSAHNIVDMKYSVSPVVKQAVDVKNAGDLPKLIEGLKRLEKSDPLVQTYPAKSGGYVIAGAGELHLEICLKDLQEDFMKGAKVTVSEPVVSFCETVTAETELVCIGKSPNKHNRVYVTMEPLDDPEAKQKLTQAIEEGRIPITDKKSRREELVKNWGWTKQECQKIWAFGQLPDAQANMMIDATKGVQYLSEAKDHIVASFTQLTAEGVLCKEPWRNIKVNVEDVVLHPDTIHRGAGQLMPATRRTCFAAQIKSGPALLEPLYECSITVPDSSLAGVYNTLAKRRGETIAQEQREGTPMIVIKAYLPVLESFGFTQLLRENTSGKAFPQMIFSHWERLAGDMYDEDKESTARTAVLTVRERKGMKPILPAFGSYYDKL